ncbi:hypothetical protein VitviT2T_023385 [Vitis vinifera]|uniref:Uncharacterized protein n=1 Tax=Vitis vinifera TaxID=29760 RepID=A0ABY9DEM1_VITVI|nr:hypothetical protein VitviT2T_023385 [Vitis vinifera]
MKLSKEQMRIVVIDWHDFVMRTAVPVDVRGGSPKSPQTNHWKRTDGACKYTSSYRCCYPYLEAHRAALAAATPITYHSRELLLVIHEHLQASGSSTTTAQLLKEAQLTPLPSLAASSSLVHQASSQETPSMQLQWPSGRIAGGFLSNKWKPNTKDEDSCLKFDSPVSSSKKKPLVFSATFSFQFRNQPQSHDAQTPAISKVFSTSKRSSVPANVPETPSMTASKPNLDAESRYKTPIIWTREFGNVHGGIHGNRRDRQFIYSRFRPWSICRDDGNGLLTSLAFLGDSTQIAAGSHSG